MIRLAVLILFQLWTIVCFAQIQMKELKVTINVANVDFESLIEKLRKEYHINIVYGVDRLSPPNKFISIHAIEMPVPELMGIICNHYNLAVEYISNYIILRPGKPNRQIIGKSNELATETTNNTVTPALDSTTNQATSEIVITTSINDSNSDSIVMIEIAKIPYENDPQPAKLNTPVKKRALQAVYLYGIYDIHWLQFKELPDPNQEYTSPNTSGFGTLYTRSVMNNFSIGIGAVYSSIQFTYHRNFNIVIPDDPVSIPNTTTLRHHFIDVPFEVGYNLKPSKRTSVKILTGSHQSWLISKEEKTKYLTHGNPNTQYFINYANKFNFGVLTAMRVTLNIHRNFDFFCEPRLIKYFNPLNEEVMSSGHLLFRTTSGLSFQLNSKI